MSTDTPPAIELRVLYGPQHGSRLPLSLGEYLLGSADDCAIILAGLRMAAHHALLTVDKNGVRLKPQDGTVNDALGNDIADERPVTLGMPLELGGIAIAIDHVDAPWPEGDAVMPLPRTPAADAPPADPPPAQTTTPAPAPQAALVLAQALKSRVLKWPPSRSALAVAGGVLATAIALMLVWPDGESHAAATTVAAAPESSMAPAAPPDEPPAELKQLLHVLDVASSVTLTLQPTGQWLVAGHVATADKKEALARALVTTSLPHTMEVYADDAQADAVTQLLKSRDDLKDVVLRVDQVHSGAVRLTGAARDAAAVEQARQAVLDGVPGLRQVDLAVMLRGELLTKLKNAIEAAGLGQRLAMVKEWPKVVLGGRLNAGERARWDELLAAFSADYGDVLPIEAVLAPPEKPALEVNIVVGGAAPFIVTNQGVRVNRGGDVDGHRLTVVSDSEVILEGPERLRIAR